MTLSAKLVLAGLAASLVLVPACAHHRHGGGGKRAAGCGGLPCGQGPGAGHHYGQTNREFQVYVYTDLEDSTKCYADIDIATLWTKTKKNNGQPVSQTVTWFSDDGNAYVVDFRKGHNGSPFADTYFVVPAGGSKSSGNLNSTASGYYDFAILPGSDPNTQNVCKDPSDPGYRVSP